MQHAEMKYNMLSFLLSITQ